jgi:predicted nuclease of restriction endonuclease-like (RecB) superfamily
MDKMINKSAYKTFVEEIKEKVRKAQYQALQAVNRHLIELYLDIGKSIVEKQKQHGWGKSIVENLSGDLQNEFPGMQGFSSRNLWNMRVFYIEYSKSEKLQPLAAEISFSHNIIIIAGCKDLLEREFYMQMTKRYGWTKNVLTHHIEGKSYEKFLLNQTNFDKTVPEKYRHQAKLAVKDEYNFEFLELGEEHQERELELGLIKNIRGFLQEMGGDFTFIGNQYKVQVEDEEFFIDLLLYHRKLKSLIVIELKTGKFKPEYAGKMQFYLSVLDEKIKQPDENPSIGIIVCKSKNRTVVEYTLKRAKHPIGVASYTVTGKLPENMKKYLPSPKEIIEKLSGFIDLEE